MNSRWRNPSNVANLITLSRLALALSAFLISINGTAAKIAWLAIVAVAALSDIVDGQFARRFSATSTVGYYLDLVVDRTFFTACLIALLSVRILPGILVLLILTREFFVLGLHAYAAAAKSAVPRTVAELAKTIGLFAGLGICAFEPSTGRLILWVTVFLAIGSAAELTIRVSRQAQDSRRSVGA